MGDVDLDKKKESITIKLAEQRFTVKRVVTGVLQLYGEYTREAGEKLEQIGYLQDRMEKFSELSPEEIEKADEELKQIVDEVDEFSKGKINRLLEIIELILTKNGYEFDRQWWIENADMTDYQSFINACINKDLPDVKKKKTVG